MEEKHKNCSTCSPLADREEAFEKEGFKKESTKLPPASKKLELVKAFNKNFSPSLRHVKQCKECGTYYFLRVKYKFLIGGSEKEFFLDRITDEKAQEYLGTK